MDWCRLPCNRGEYGGEKTLPRSGGLTYGRIGDSISRLSDAALLHKTLLPIFQQTPELGIIRLTDSEFVWE